MSCHQTFESTATTSLKHVAIGRLTIGHLGILWNLLHVSHLSDTCAHGFTQACFNNDLSQAADGCPNCLCSFSTILMPSFLDYLCYKPGHQRGPRKVSLAHEVACRKAK